MFVNVVSRAFVGRQRHPICLTALALEEGTGPLIGREDARGSAELRAHVGDDVPIHCRQTVQTRPVILHNSAVTSLDAMPSQHLEDDVLCAHPIRECSAKPHAPDLGHAQMQWLSGHGERDFQATGTESEHSK